ncbi:hypothetical protein K1W54_20675, partial [Micromonospora sp. CPCC 205371]|nr:hypothetical protein [Micromonospora sp. CPCC 205371]
MIATTRPPIRLRPVPALDPPFEDEIGQEPWHAQLALQFDLTGRRQARPPVLVPGTGAAAARGPRRAPPTRGPRRAGG